MPPPIPQTPNIPQPVIAPPTAKQQSWGTVISLVIIMAMIIVGAFYAWGKRVAENKKLYQSETTSQTY